MRHLLALFVGAVVAALGALILGEYELRGLMTVVAGVLFGLAVAEAMVAVGRAIRIELVIGAAVFAAAGMVWSSWIAAGRDWAYVSGARWGAAAIAAVAAALWVRSSGRREADSPSEPSQTPSE